MMGCVEVRVRGFLVASGLNTINLKQSWSQLCTFVARNPPRQNKSRHEINGFVPSPKVYLQREKHNIPMLIPA